LHAALYWSIMPPIKHPGETVMRDDDPQRLSNTEQLEILTLLETASTERSAMHAARALAQLMRHLHALGQRIAVELPDQDRNGTPTVR
jgi:DNA repair protein RadC